MSDECIHGFEAGMCASCYPKPAPEIPAGTVRTATRPKLLAGTRAAVARPRTTAGSARLDNVGEQRIYHLTHISNLPGILESGTVFAFENPGFAGPTFDLASTGTRSDRSGTPVAGSGDATVAHFVPFFLSPNASLWETIRSGDPSFQFGPAVAQADAADFVLLVSTVATLSESDAAYVVSDGDAAHVLTRFATTRDDVERALRRFRADRVSNVLDHAEFMVRESVPFASISLIGVAHDKARAAVRELLAGCDAAPKVAVYPPWFAAPEA